MAVVELVVDRLSKNYRDRDTDLSLSLLSRSVTLLRASPPLLSSPLLFSLSYRRFPPRLSVLPPPDDSLLHEKSGRRLLSSLYPGTSLELYPTAATTVEATPGDKSGRTRADALRLLKQLPLYYLSR